MKKINPRRYLLNATITFAVTGILLAIILQDAVIDSIIQNTLVWFYINQVKPVIVFLFLGAIFFYFLRKALSKQQYLSKTMEEARMNQIQVLENIKKEYFFFRHVPGHPFDYISVGIREMFGYQRDDFRQHFRKYGFGYLFDTVSGLLEENAENVTVSPEYEYAAYTSDGRKKFIQVRFTPIFNDDGNVSSIEGVVKDISLLKKTEAVLAEKEMMYRTLFEANNEAVVILKADKFIDCNRKVTELFDASIEEIIMHTPYSYRFSPSTQPDGRSSREKALEKIRMALSGPTQVFAWQHLKSSGQPIMVEVSLTRFQEGTEYYLFGILREIDAEVLAKHNLKAQMDNVTNIIRNSPFAIAVFDHQFHFTEVNEPFAALTGYAADKIRSSLPRELFRDEGFLTGFSKCSNGENTVYSGTLSCGNGNPKFIYASFIPAFDNFQKPDGGIVIVEELTELQQIRSRYSECERGMKDILQNAREILYKVNCRSGKYEYMSQSVTDVLGYLPDEIYKMDEESLKNLLHPEDREKSNQILARLIVPEPGHEVRRIIDYRIQHKDGTYRWFSDKYSVLFDEQGQPAYISGNIIDITKFKEAEEVMRKLAPENN